MKPEISTYISSLTGAANLAICRLLGSGKRKQSLGHGDIQRRIYANVKSNNISFQIFVYSRSKHLPSYFRPYNLQDIHVGRKITIRFIIWYIEYTHRRQSGDGCLWQPRTRRGERELWIIQSKQKKRRREPNKRENYCARISRIQKTRI